MSPHETRPKLLARLPLEALRRVIKEGAAQGHDPEKLRLANDALEAVRLKGKQQTEELYNSGQLFEDIEAPSLANGGRIIARYRGDPMAWMQPFMSPGVCGKIDRDAGIERYETRKVLKSHGYIG
ncbi:MAG TPA: hypothetical protein VMU87_16325 [Stellaceae bacterium]|nr:hypothetical protein [Stellaceae bacterium]